MDSEFKYGKRLRELRRAHGLSQDEVASGAGITTSYYGLLERGRANPSVGLLEKICRVLNISLREIFDESVKSTLELDALSMQLVYQLSNSSDDEKELILTLIKGIRKITGTEIE